MSHKCSPQSIHTMPATHTPCCPLLVVVCASPCPLPKQQPRLHVFARAGQQSRQFYQGGDEHGQTCPRRCIASHQVCTHTQTHTHKHSSRSKLLTTFTRFCFPLLTPLLVQTRGQGWHACCAWRVQLPGALWGEFAAAKALCVGVECICFGHSGSDVTRRCRHRCKGSQAGCSETERGRREPARTAVFSSIAICSTTAAGTAAARRLTATAAVTTAANNQACRW